MDTHESRTAAEAPPPTGEGTILRSWEVRWFSTGAPPEPVIRAFLSLPLGPKADGLVPPGWSPIRTDHYLVLARDMGIKTRQDPGGVPRLEFKGRVAGPERADFGSQSAGWAEEWIKWSYGTAAVPPERGWESEPGGAPTKEVSPRTPVPRGIQLELARGRVGGASGALFWSVGLEAFPPGPGLAEVVLRSTTSLLEGLVGVAGPVFTESSSRSYPAWLTEQDRDAGRG